MTVPRVFGLPHLSEDAVAAFADGVLSDTAAARARKHCSECTECAQAVRVQRETAMMLRTASSPTMPAGLLDRLTHLPMSAPMPPPHSRPADHARSRWHSGLRGPQPAVAQAPGRGRSRPRRTPRPGQDQQGRDQYRGQDRPQPNNHHRRTLLPVGILAASAAVVAAGTIGSNVTAAPTPTESAAAGRGPAGGQHGVLPASVQSRAHRARQQRAVPARAPGAGHQPAAGTTLKLVGHSYVRQTRSVPVRPRSAGGPE